jgi:hypothetical protein
MTALVQTIPFDEILPGATVRFTVYDGTQFLSVRDLIMSVCAKDNKAASKIWERISGERMVKNELQESIRRFQFQGRGQSEQPVITLPAALKLVMILPGRHATQYKVKCAEIISRYLDGDASMNDEIKENHTIGQKRSYLRFAKQAVNRIDADKENEVLEHQYIYATKSAAFPGLIKIGRTSNMQARLLQLNTACAPSPHAVVSIVPSMNMHRDECLAHTHFASKRKAGEFFELDESDVKKYFEEVILRRYQRELLSSVQNLK